MLYVTLYNNFDVVLIKFDSNANSICFSKIHMLQPAVCRIRPYNGTVPYRRGFEITSLRYGYGYGLYRIETVKCTAVTVYGYGEHPYDSLLLTESTIF